MGYYKAFLSAAYILVASVMFYFLGNINPKIINLIDSTNEKIAATTVYYISIFAIFAIPQYLLWVEDDDQPITTPIKSMAVVAVSFLFVLAVSLAKDKIFNAITLSDSANIIFYLCYWIAIIGVMIVPQVIVFRPELAVGDRDSI